MSQGYRQQRYYLCLVRIQDKEQQPNTKHPVREEPITVYINNSPISCDLLSGNTTTPHICIFRFHTIDINVSYTFNNRRTQNTYKTPNLNAKLRQRDQRNN